MRWIASSAIGEACGAMDVDELAPDVGHAGDLADGAGAIELVEAGIAVGMHQAAEAGEMVLRVLALAVAREAIPGRRRSRAAPGPLVADIGPEPGGPGLAGAGREHADRRVVGEDRPGREHVPADGVGQRREQRGRLADPVGQGGAVEVEPVALEDLALAIERQVVGVLADQHMGEQAGTGAAALDGPRRQRRLARSARSRCRPAAGRTIRFTTKRPGTYSSSSVTSSPIRRSLPPQSAQASAAGLSSTSMRGTWSGIGRRFGRSFSSTSGRRSRAVIAAAAISLVSSASCSCSAVSDEAPKRWRAMAGQLVAQLLDQHRLRLHLGEEPRGEGAQLLGVFRQGGGLVEHG